MDGAGGVELVVGRQVSNEVVHALSAYTFSQGTPETLLTANYSRFLTVDLDRDNLRELFLLRPGADGGNGVAELYDYRGGAMERSAEAVDVGPGGESEADDGRGVCTKRPKQCLPPATTMRIPSSQMFTP